MDQPPPIPEQPSESWWKRNWKWFLPVGCLTGCLTFIVLGVAFAGTIAMVVFGAIRSTDVYKDALARAKANPAVTSALGSPIKEGFFVSGNTNVNGASGEANLSIPISGPKGSGTIYVEAKKSMGHWKYSNLAVEIEKTRERINLLQAPESAQDDDDDDDEEDESADQT